VQNFSYIVAEGDLPSASRLLEIECGLPYSDPEPFLLDTSGDVYGKAILHRLTESKSMGGVKYLALYPDTYVSFLPSELSPNPDPTLKNVWIPDPPALYAALFRMISTYPKTDVSRGAFVTDLSLLIMYHLYPQHDDDSEDDDDEDIEHALATIRGWCQEWRFGEEWIRDALTEVTRTGLVSNLPWWSD
jgi:hypothetical protein